MKEHDLLWAMLPPGLEAYFDVEGFEQAGEGFRITLVGRNELPSELPEEYRGRRVINTLLKTKVVESFPIRGKKAEIVLKKRYWKFEGVKKLLSRKIDICAEGTGLDKDFAVFLKEFYRQFPDSDLPSGYVDESELEQLRKAVQEQAE